MNARLLKITPMLETPNIKATVEFYVQVLGFSCNNFTKNAEWVHLTKNNIDIMFTLPNKHENRPAPIMSGSLYFNTDNVDSIWLQLKDTCKICYGIENFYYGMREFAIYDNNGYLLQFGEEIKTLEKQNE